MSALIGASSLEHDAVHLLPRTRDGRVGDATRHRRIIEVAAFVALWVSAGYLLPINGNGYLLLGIPLTIAFQLLVRRRPLRELFAFGTTRFTLDGPGRVLAIVLAVAPGVFAVRAVSAGNWVNAGWYLAAIGGAVCAAFALRNGSARSALRSAALPLAVGSTGMAAVYSGLHFATGTPISAAVVVTGIVQYSLLYFPATFLLEEVSFRGALDAHVHHDGERRGLMSALLISVLWGLWHLPVSKGLPFPIQVGELVCVHVLLGVPLSLAWRRTRNLSGPALAHAVNDAVRNAFMVGL
jgi:membrane protease YdiL (CAAX protease family)